VGNSIGWRKVCKSGHSEISGDYVVEEVQGDGNVIYRRLVFLSNQNVVQSEAKLKSGSYCKILLMYAYLSHFFLNLLFYYSGRYCLR
jgi:hypothetical protein